MFFTISLLRQEHNERHTLRCFPQSPYCTRSTMKGTPWDVFHNLLTAPGAQWKAHLEMFFTISLLRQEHNERHTLRCFSQSPYCARSTMKGTPWDVFHNLLTAPWAVFKMYTQEARVQSWTNHMQTHSCSMCYEEAAQLISLTEFKLNLFHLYFVGWNHARIKGKRKQKYLEKTADYESQKIQHTTAPKFKPQPKLKPAPKHSWQALARKADVCLPCHHTSPQYANKTITLSPP